MFQIAIELCLFGESCSALMVVTKKAGLFARPIFLRLFQARRQASFLVVFFAAGFFAAVFFAGAFLATVFLAVFLAGAFFATGFFSGGISSFSQVQSSCGHLCTVPQRLVVLISVRGQAHFGQASCFGGFQRAYLHFG